MKSTPPSSRSYWTAITSLPPEPFSQAGSGDHGLLSDSNVLTTMQKRAFSGEKKVFLLNLMFVRVDPAIGHSCTDTPSLLSAAHCNRLIQSSPQAAAAHSSFNASEALGPASRNSLDKHRENSRQLERPPAIVEPPLSAATSRGSSRNRGTFSKQKGESNGKARTIGSWPKYGPLG